MNYGYIRTGSKEQESQRLEIEGYAKNKGIAIGQWIENITTAVDGDIVIASEIPQLGREPLQALERLKHLLNTGAQLWTVKEGYKLGGDNSGKILAFAFGLSAEIKRKLISEHTREALVCVKADGRRLGRPPGRRNTKSKLAGRALEVHRLLAAGCTRVEAARKLGVSRTTLAAFLN